MQVSNALKKFLKENRDILNNYEYTKDFTGLYRYLIRNLYNSRDIGTFSELLYALNINPLKYMFQIPAYFMYGAAISAIVIPDHIKEIGEDAFLNCENLEKIELPANLIKIYPGAFDDCTNLKTIIYKGPKPIESLFVDKSEVPHMQNLFK